MRLVRAAMVVTACGGATGPADSGTDPAVDHELVLFETTLVDGFLCPDAEAPEQAEDVLFIDCAIEGENDRDPPPTDSLLVMAWNIERGQQLDAQLAAFASGALPTPDVLLLSEADRGCPRSGSRNVTQVLADALDMNWAFAVEFVELPRGDSEVTCEHGNAVLSRYPLANVQQRRHEANLSWYDNPGEPRLGGRIAIAADVVVGDRALHVATVHFESDVSELDVQVAQAVETATAAAAQPLPAIVGGDTNAPFYTFDLRQGSANDETIGAFLDRGFADAHLDLDPFARATCNGLVLDLLLTRGVTTVEPALCADDVCDPLSDHLAVWARVPLH